ncbi:1119_t:CDS:2 [Entrophospora sp. SA101]|nr:1119_t:CDS:2 [Entrophospora sp. SA101]
MTILKSKLYLEKIWVEVINHLKKAKIQVQSIEAQIIDLSGWATIDWNTILYYYTNLTNDYQKFDCIAEIRNFGLELLLLEAGDDKTDIYGRKYHNDHSQLKIALKDCLDMFMEWLHLSTAEISEICTLGLQIIDYTNLTNDYQKFDCIAEIRNFGLELLLLEAGDDKTDIYGRKYHNDHSQLKIALKDCLDMFMEWLHLSTAEISEICTLGLQIIDTKWIIYSMTYDPLSKYYFFHQLCSFHFPTSFSDLEFFLPYLIENLLSLRHTMLNMVNKTKEVTIAARTTTPSPQSSPLHETPETPPQIK